MNDLRFAFRQLLKNPGFTAVAVLTLALGIGANTIVFSVVNALMFRPLPFENPDELFAIRHKNPKGELSDYGLDYSKVRELRAHPCQSAELIAFGYLYLKWAGNDREREVRGEIVSGNYFSTLGIPAAAGRTFSTEEDQTPGAHPVAVVSHRFWQQQFNGDPQIVGQKIILSGRYNSPQTFDIIGVAPAGFAGFQPKMALSQPDIWVPTAMHPQMDHGSGDLRLLGRRRPGATLAQAKVELEALMQIVRDESPGHNIAANGDRRKEIPSIPAGSGLVGRQDRVELIRAGRGSWGPFQSAELQHKVGKIFGLFAGAVGLVLGIACANVAHLLLVRAVRRRKEIAVRRALGARRSQIIRQLLTESCLLALLGGTAGLVLSLWGREAVLTLKPQVVSYIPVDLALDGRVIAFTIVLSLVVSLISGLAPAFQGIHFDLLSTLKDETTGFVQGTGRFRLRSLFVIAQFAVCLVLLAGAGLCLRSFVRLQTTDPGFNAKNVLVVPLASTTSGFIATNTFNRQLLERIAALPGVRAASFTRCLPMTPDRATLGGGPDMIEGYQARPGEIVLLTANSVAPDFFKTLEVPLIRGREFTHRDKAERDMPVIVNETTARRYWRGQDAIGKRIRYNRRLFEVVGVVRDYRRFNLWEPPVPEVFSPMEDAERGHLLVRTAGNPRLMLAAVRNEIQSLDKEIDVSNSITLEEVLDRSLGTQRSALLILGTFAVVALLLSGIGIYGVMSYVVSLRTREIGVRMALGAQRAEVLSRVLRDGLKLAGGGLICGLGAAFGATRLIRSWLYEVTPTDPLTFAGVAIVLVTVALLACWLPARRAAKVDPMEALRYE